MPTFSPRERPANLRTAALIHYCFTCPDTSIGKMSRVNPFDQVSRQTLENWSKADRWVERREKAREELIIHAQRRIGDRLIDQHVEQLESLERISKQVCAILDSDQLRSKSYETMINAYLKLAKARIELGDKLLAALRPQQSDDRPQIPVELSDDDKEAFTEFINERRRKRACRNRTVRQKRRATKY